MLLCPSVSTWGLQWASVGHWLDHFQLYVPVFFPVTFSSALQEMTVFLTDGSRCVSLSVNFNSGFRGGLAMVCYKKGVLGVMH